MIFTKLIKTAHQYAYSAAKVISASFILSMSAAMVAGVSASLVGVPASAGGLDKPDKKDGTEIGGGGNVTEARPAEIYALAQAVGFSKILLKMFLNQIHENKKDLSHLKWIKENLSQQVYANFRSSKKSLAMLHNTKIHIQKAPCIYDDKAKDGSVLPNNDICISSGEILSHKLTTDDLTQKIIGLIAHEYTHLLGGNEVEAQFIQDDIESNFTSGTTIRGLVNLSYSDFGLSGLNGLNSKWLDFEEAVKSNSKLAICNSSERYFESQMNSFEDYRTYSEKISHYWPTLVLNENDLIEEPLMPTIISISAEPLMPTLITISAVCAREIKEMGETSRSTFGFLSEILKDRESISELEINYEWQKRNLKIEALNKNIFYPPKNLNEKSVE
ncbi:MAG: hypothetical protein ABL927_02775, partial [Bdellovibrionales bacterium]